MPRAITPGVTELHLHLEGSLSIESAIEIAARGEHPWGKLTRASVHRSLRFKSLNDFLGSVRNMAQVLSSVHALERASRELSLFLHENGVLYAEVYASPYIYVRWGLNFADVMNAIDRGFSAGEAAHGARCAVLLDSVRQWGPDAASIVLDGYESNPLDRFIGFGLGGEESVPLEDFVGIFDRARDLGLRTVVHAGECGPATDVRKAIELLGVERIAHGIRALDDDATLAIAAERRVAFDVAITSNYKTRAVTGPHPIGDLVRRGVAVTLSTDDPSLFRTNLRREYVRALRLSTLEVADLQQIAKNGIDYSFADAQTKQSLHDALRLRISEQSSAG